MPEDDSKPDDEYVTTSMYMARQRGRHLPIFSVTAKALRAHNSEIAYCRGCTLIRLKVINALCQSCQEKSNKKDTLY